MRKLRSEGLPHLVELAIRTVLDKLKSDVGSIANSWKTQSTNIDGDTSLAALSFEVRNGKLVTTVSGVEVLKRVRVGVSRDLDPDCEKGGEQVKGSVPASWTNRSIAGGQS